MSDTPVNPVENPNLKNGSGEMLALVVAAGGTTLGLGSFATLCSVSLNEQLYRFIDANLTGVQVLTSSIFQAAFALFLVQLYFPQLLAGGRKASWHAVSVVVGLLLVVWLSENAHHAWSPLPAAVRRDLAPSEIIFGSPFWDAVIWILHAVIFSAVFEALLFEGYMFHALRGLPLWLIGCAVLFFFCVAGGYALGFDGILGNLKLGSVLVSLRLMGGSFTYSAVAAAIYRGADQFAFQWLTQS